MSKIGNLIVELEETGAIEYDSQSREYITARERPVEEGLSITAGVITKRHRKNLRSDGSWAIIFSGDSR
jgi:hypothetical protein